MSAPSNALISFQSGGSGDSGFSNSGQIDWVTLAGSSVKFTVDVLARLSKAGIEAFTLAASYAVLGRFKLGNQAEIEVYNSVGKLKAFSSFNSALYFGFGVKHVVRSLADSAEGLSIVSLCSILADFYGIDHSGLILRELFKLLNPPVEFTLTRTQWTSLIKACVGALSHSNFKNHLTGISSLYYGLNKELKQLVRGNAVQIATALFGLNQVSSGKINEVLIVGGADCALIAAIASWLLDPESGSQHTDFDPEYRLVPTSTLMACFKSDIQRPTFQDPNDQRKWAFVLFVDDLFSEIAILSLYHKRPGYDPYPSLYSIPFFPVLCESSKLDEYVAVERARQGDLTNTVAMGHLMMQTRGLVLSLDSPTTTRPFYPLLILQR